MKAIAFANNDIAMIAWTFSGKWQDGAVLVDLGNDGWAGYFTAFTQQLIPTDDLGNPTDNSQPI